jgi:hypothetical protein
MFIRGTAAACEETGFVPKHARACISVAQQQDCIISFREPGKAAQGLIADNYSMKGFRIDTKSCNWGPMYGFVCVDPRLSKKNASGGSYYTKNKGWTEEAMRGEINHAFFGHPSTAETAGWKADTCPLVISQTRVDELVTKNIITNPARDENGILTGNSSQTFNGSGEGSGTVTVPWALVPVTYRPYRFNPPVLWLKGENGPYFVVCIQKNSDFALEYPTGTAPILFRGYETIQGMCNPGDKNRGFKACVTADYDLFSIWPRRAARGRVDRADAHHQVMSQLNLTGFTRRGHGIFNPMPTNVARMPHVDTRLSSTHRDEHWKYGDISARVLNTKVILNTAIQSSGGYEGGNSIHHNDEAGNFKLAKGSLADCMPLLFFYPQGTGLRFILGGLGCGAVTTAGDFGRMAVLINREFHVVCKPSWQSELGIRL